MQSRAIERKGMVAKRESEREENGKYWATDEQTDDVIINHVLKGLLLASDSKAARANLTEKVHRSQQTRVFAPRWKSSERSAPL